MPIKPEYPKFHGFEDLARSDPASTDTPLPASPQDRTLTPPSVASGDPSRVILGRTARLEESSRAETLHCDLPLGAFPPPAGRRPRTSGKPPRAPGAPWRSRHGTAARAISSGSSDAREDGVPRSPRLPTARFRSSISRAAVSSAISWIKLSARPLQTSEGRCFQQGRGERRKVSTRACEIATIGWRFST